MMIRIADAQAGGTSVCRIRTVAASTQTSPHSAAVSYARRGLSIGIPGRRLVSRATSTAVADAPTRTTEDEVLEYREDSATRPSATSGGPQENVPRPGRADDSWFEQHWSVDYWRPRASRTQQEKADVRELASVAAMSARQANVLQDRTSAAYWTYHTARWAFFLTQASAQLLFMSARNGDLAKGKISFVNGPMDAGAFTQLAWDLSSEAFGAFECDLRNIREGGYKLPWDMTTPGHRQADPLHILRQGMLYLQEAPLVLGRRREPEGKVGLLPFERSPLYPDYYQNNFHFQTDGWFSSQSAEVYDISTETLFVGRQDAMQRGTLLAMNRHFPGSDGSGLEVLEVAAGTGRFATFFRDNYPAARLTVSDLSPFYLERARSAMAYWERCASPAARRAGSASFLQCAAERLPQPDASLDVVYCVYMFHEVPNDVRRAALREFARVLKPGGVLIITDSVQFGDRDAVADLDAFEELNEPHYGSYLRFSFGPELATAGLQPHFKSLASSSKTLSAVKQ